MQYETIILELLTRVKALENDVNELKQAQLRTQGNDIAEDNDHRVTSTAKAPYTKLTDEMIDLCYEYGKRVAAGENIQKLSKYVSDTTGMNRNTAFMHIYVVQCMLEGKIYKRGISSKATKRYFDAIFSEYGSAGLKRAINAARLNIAYREECGIPSDSVKEICDSYEIRL